MKKRLKISNFLLLAICLSLITSSCKKSVENDPSDIKDSDGNIYTSVVIGTQTWLVENLKTTKFDDGTDIPLVTNNTAWKDLTTPGYCFYNNDEATYKNTYGALYNWFAVNTGKLCPTGWHVPIKAEWETLIGYLGGSSAAGGKLKEMGTTHWNSPNTGATNEKGFTALPGGFRNAYLTFADIKSFGAWWTKTPDSGNGDYAYYYIMDNISPDVYDNNFHKKNGHSVRCLKD